MSTSPCPGPGCHRRHIEQSAFAATGTLQRSCPPRVLLSNLPGVREGGALSGLPSAGSDAMLLRRKAAGGSSMPGANLPIITLRFRADDLVAVVMLG